MLCLRWWWRFRYPWWGCWTHSWHIGSGGNGLVRCLLTMLNTARLFPFLSSSTGTESSVHNSTNWATLHLGNISQISSIILSAAILVPLMFPEIFSQPKPSYQSKTLYTLSPSTFTLWLCYKNMDLSNSPSTFQAEATSTPHHWTPPTKSFH